MFYKFDYNKLEEFEIVLSNLPEQSKIINQPDTFWRNNKKIVITVALVMLMLLSIVFILSFLYKKSKEVEKEIKQKNKKLKKLSRKLISTNKELNYSKVRAEESDRLKTAFLANLSHEIRTPMNGILGFSNLLQLGDLTDDEKEQYLTLIDSSGRRMLALIDDLVNISKIESGTLELENTEFNLVKLLEEIYAFFEKEAINKNLKLELFNNGYDGYVVNLDRGKLEQIFYNFIKNALKFTNTGVIKFGFNKNGNSIDFFVEDTGMGIPNESMNIIFKRFHQVSSLKNKNQEGVGLGLSITKEFVELMGGKIQVQSEINKGSKFLFTLPCNITALRSIWLQ